jgi:hypothetical protein
MSISQMRLSAIAITSLLAASTRDTTTWQSAVLSIGFGHYLLSAWYARSKLAKVAGNWSTALPMAATVAVGTALYLGSFPLIIYFAVHHVFNEVYLGTEELKRLNTSQQRHFRAIAIPLQTLLYFCLLRRDQELVYLNGNVLLVSLAIAYVCYFVLLFRLRRHCRGRNLLELAAFEIAGMCMVAVSFLTTVRFLDIVCYHFVFWWFYPAAKLASKRRSAVRDYAIQMGLLIGGSFLLSPAGLIGDYPFRDSVYLKQFILWSHIHITSSFFLSAAHPAWITRWFTPRTAAAPLPTVLA